MALTRKALKAMGLTDEQVDSVIELHTETADALRSQITDYKSKADELDDVRAELDTLRASGFKEKYEKEHSDFESYKAEQNAKETRAAKNTAVRKYFESKGITGKGLEIAMRGAGAEITAAELDGEKIKDTTALDALISGDYATLVSSQKQNNADVNHPPINNPPRAYSHSELKGMSATEINKNWDSIKASLNDKKG